MARHESIFGAVGVDSKVLDTKSQSIRLNAWSPNLAGIRLTRKLTSSDGQLPALPRRWFNKPPFFGTLILIGPRLVLLGKTSSVYLFRYSSFRVLDETELKRNFGGEALYLARRLSLVSLDADSDFL